MPYRSLPLPARLRSLLIAAAAMALSACPSPPRPVPPPIASEPQPTKRPAPSAAANYTVNESGSEVLILVRRGGTLARLGHNHVISTRALQGRIWVADSLAASSFELEFPVSALSVDTDTARAAAGEEFTAPVPPADKEATRTNMLRTEVLDGEQFPKVTLQSVQVSGTAAELMVETRITIKDVSHTLVVPTTLRTEGNRLVASGQFTLRQTDFGIKPFSVALGALQVQDALEIRFRIVADREG